MRRLISIVLLSFYLVSTTELYQLLKIPVLIEHFLQHKGQNKNITLIDFLKMHYDHPVKDADYQTDQKLPFVSHANLLSVVFIINPSVDFHFTDKTYNAPGIKKTFYKSILYNKEILNSIWEPPKFYQS